MASFSLLRQQPRAAYGSRRMCVAFYQQCTGRAQSLGHVPALIGLLRRRQRRQSLEGTCSTRKRSFRAHRFAYSVDLPAANHTGMRQSTYCHTENVHRFTAGYWRARTW